MNRRFHTNPFVTDPDEPELENGPDSPSSGDDTKISSAPSPKKSKRDLKKRVVSVPIGDVEGSKSKGEAYPPSDSWAWRKYGQKPIKGSPYPRGYYRCSSSKGCPARKQVERSHVNPTALLITYACDHNHPLPTSKYHSSSSSSSSSSTKAAAAATSDTISKRPAKFPPEEPAVFSEDPSSSSPPPPPPLLLDDHFEWYSDVATTKILESPVSAGSMCTEADVAMVFTMGEEEESLFADLGELPECSLVFRSRRSVVEPEPDDNDNSNSNSNNNVESKRTSCGLSVLPCCGTTG